MGGCVCLSCENLRTTTDNRPPPANLVDKALRPWWITYRTCVRSASDTPPLTVSAAPTFAASRRLASVGSPAQTHVGHLDAPNVAAKAKAERIGGCVATHKATDDSRQPTRPILAPSLRTKPGMEAYASGAPKYGAQRSRGGSSSAPQTARQIVLLGRPSASACRTVRLPRSARLNSAAQTR
jgi:hypothetical protein